jgi:hypothetical protein
MRHPHYRPEGFFLSDFFFACLALSISVTILSCASRPALRDGSHFLEWELQRLNGEAFVADVLLSSA